MGLLLTQTRLLSLIQVGWGTLETVVNFGRGSLFSIVSRSIPNDASGILFLPVSGPFVLIPKALLVCTTIFVGGRPFALSSNLLREKQTYGSIVAMECDGEFNA